MVRRTLPQITAAKVNQFDLHGFGIDDNVFRFYVTVENSAPMAVEGRFNNLQHENKYIVNLS